MSGLPDIIPVFPLPNVVLFPKVQLPLHIFEARYREMVHDASQQDRPLIGMALLHGNWQSESNDNPAIFSLGCVGEIARLMPLPDGRFNLLLQGLCEFQIQEEFRSKRYRQARVEWRPRSSDKLPAGLRKELGGLLEDHLSKNEAVQKFLADTSVKDEFFVNFFAFHLDLLPIEKQSLLECASVPERASRLREILDFKLTEARLVGGTTGNTRMQ